MTMINVQFSDAAESAIASYFSCAQDPAVWKNMGTVDISDPRYVQFIRPAPTPATNAVVALGAGLTIVSTATPALNGTYAIDQLTQMDIIAIETSLNAGKGFPGGAAMFNYHDMSGVLHVFSAANFTNFAAAVRDYVYMLKALIAGASTALPASTTSID